MIKVKIRQCKHRNCTGCAPNNCPGPSKCKAYMAAVTGTKFYPAGVNGNKRCKYKGCEGCTPEACPGCKNCKPMRREAGKVERRDHPERVKIRQQKYKDNNPENFRACVQKSNIKRAEAKKSWYTANFDSISERAHLNYLANRDYILEYSQKWHQANDIRRGKIIGIQRANGTIDTWKFHSIPECYWALYLESLNEPYEREVAYDIPDMGRYYVDSVSQKFGLIEIKSRHTITAYPESAKLQEEKRRWLREQGIHVSMLDADTLETELNNIGVYFEELEHTNERQIFKLVNMNAAI